MGRSITQIPTSVIPHYPHSLVALTMLADLIDLDARGSIRDFAL